MAQSASTDSKLDISLTASTAQATQAVNTATGEISRALSSVSDAAARAGQGMEGAFSRASTAAERTAKSVSQISERAEISSRQLRQMAVGMAGLALNAYGAYQDAHGGRSAGTAYAQGALSGAATGAAVGMTFGPVGAAVGAGVGGAVGLFTTYQQREAAEKAEEEARKQAVKQMQDQVAAYEKLTAETAKFQTLLSTLGDTSADAASRSALLQQEIEKRKAQDETLAEAQRKAAAANQQERFAELSGQRTRNASQLSALERFHIAEQERGTGHSAASAGQVNSTLGDSYLKKGMDLFGVGEATSSATTIARQHLDIGRAQLSTLSHIEEVLRSRAGETISLSAAWA